MSDNFSDAALVLVGHGSTLNAEGKPVHFVAGGLLARAVQHEADHLNGILFIDRMSSASKAELKAELQDLQEQTKARLGEK